MTERRHVLCRLFVYAKNMKNLIDAAYLKLAQLEKSQPSWETYARISDLVASLKYLESKSVIETSDLSTLISDMRTTLGDARTLDILSRTLTDFKNDLNCISPHLTVCLVDKIKENLQ